VYFSNTVFIDRTDRKSAVAAFSNAASHMREKRQNVFIFPEGTRSYFDQPDLLPFKKGAFHLAVEAQVPIVPVVCGNYSHVLNLKKMIFNGGRIPVKVLPAIETTGLTAADVPALVEKVRDQMLTTIKELAIKTKTTNGTSTAPGLREKSKIAMSSPS
jgi:lysophosphatidate acyltransferase